VQAHQALCTRCDCARQPANSHNPLQRHDYAHLAHARAMTRDDDLHVRLGRVRDKGRGSAHRAKPFIARALAAAERAGGLQRRSRRRSTAFGRGRAASIAAARLMTNRTRSVAVKARVVRHPQGGTAWHSHGLSAAGRRNEDGAPGRMLDAGHHNADHRAFAERSEADRHHFRPIMPPGRRETLRSKGILPAT
jgi:hypothetical protein